jgi:TOMM system kinase/cyclase fusion protein
VVASSIQLDDLRQAVRDAYDVSTPLGQGGYGTVFRALHRRSGQPVALKVQRLRQDGDGRDPAYRIARFEREAKLCAALEHPHIVRLIDEGRFGDYLVLAFELVDGETLSAHLARRGALQPYEAAALMAQILDALDAAHSRGIVHRDLKPDNVMIVAGLSPPHAKILDFGVAAFAPELADREPALTLSREILGTPCYSAPEQLRGEPATARSDLYAWALVFLECLTGCRVMDGATIAQVFHKQLSSAEVPLPAALASHPLGALLRQALAKSSRRRPHDAARLLGALRHTDLTDLHGQLAPASAGLGPKTLALEAARFPVGEHRQVTAVSAGLRVTPAHSAAADVEALDTAQKDRLRTLADVLQRFGGHVLGTLAGRTLAVFGLPAASESDPRRAALAALELIAAIAPGGPLHVAGLALGVELRIGMHTGSAILDDAGAVSGPALDMACELEVQAPPGGILVSPITRQILRKQMSFERAGVAARGAEPQVSYRLVAERSGDSWRVLGAGVELVARDAELGLLLAHFRDARSGAGRVVLVRGDAGIGKSRVVAELCLRARRSGAALHDGHCLPEHSSSALQPIRALVQQRLDVVDGALDAASLREELCDAGLDPELSLPALAAWLSLPFAAACASPSPERQRELLLGTLAALLSSWSGEHGGILVLEDVHWCDPSTSELLVRLSRSVARRPILLVLTSQEAIDAGVHLDATIELSGLDADGARRVVAAQPGSTRLTAELVEMIVERTDGIPLFIEELTRSLVDAAHEPALAAGTGPIPPGLRDLLHGKLDRLGAAKETAQLAAAIGRDFQLELLSAISRRGAAELLADIELLLRAGVVRRRQATPDRYLFRHELLREVAWDSMLSAQRSSTHRAAARELLARAARGLPAEPAELARHHELGGAYEDAVEQYLLAGQAAARDGAYREALARFERAQACAHRLDSELERARREIDVLDAKDAVSIVLEGSRRLARTRP